MEALDRCLPDWPAWLAHETTIFGLLQDAEERVRIGNSLGITAAEARLKLNPDIMMVGVQHMIFALRKVESRGKTEPTEKKLEGHDQPTEGSKFGDRIRSRYKI